MKHSQIKWKIVNTVSLILLLVLPLLNKETLTALNELGEAMGDSKQLLIFSATSIILIGLLSFFIEYMILKFVTGLFMIDIERQALFTVLVATKILNGLLGFFISTEILTSLPWFPILREFVFALVLLLLIQFYLVEKEKGDLRSSPMFCLCIVGVNIVLPIITYFITLKG